MNNKINNNILINNINKSGVLYIVLIAYIALGCIFSITLFYYSENNYFDLFNSCLNSANFLVFFLLPVFVAIGTSNYLKNEENDFIYLRLRTKKEYFKFQILNNIAVSSLFYFCCILVLLIFVNLGGYITDPMKSSYVYGVPNIVALIIIVLKIYLFLISFQIMNTFLLKLIKNRTIHFVIIFIVLFFIRYPYLIGKLGIFRYLFPIPYISYGFDNIYVDVLFSTAYFVIIGVFFYILSRRIAIKKDIGM